ncbi:helix-turn-helix domain-containing protein [Lujinxingia vulgaris]|uniref:Helix-turn-helix domain-containing protein n=1 Tax=Lujinxingia vulgaris TaxID=2600176 RepID=A0A5C6XM10_9DELT|nr:PTS sugar transporter subunit IIA [Lujinxingia vulgaris]TXD38374.1 helix-turn-helix domain-containing protein [Lujinxingia vulgaris]
MEDRLMTARQLASYLNVSERTVLNLVQDGELPGVKVGNQWRFRKAMIDTWLDDQMLGLTPRVVDPTPHPAPRQMLSLQSCFEPSHVCPQLHATTKTGVISELAAFAASRGLVRDDTWFVGALIKRENVMPSAVGQGLAFPHTLRRHPEQIARPFMILGRSPTGVDFDALDGQPTYLFFVLGLRYEELHLPWLARLVQMLASPALVKTLREAPDANAIYDALILAQPPLQTGPQP